MKSFVYIFALGASTAAILAGAAVVLSTSWAEPSEPARRPSFGMKLVNETVTDSDLDQMRDLGITVLEGEWGMDEADPAAFRNLLNRAQSRGMKWIINFSDEAGWGYSESKSESQEPSWQGERVKKYIEDLGEHPAIYGYDISNEAGENLPNGKQFRITSEQLQQAAADVRSVNERHPVIMRMHDWDSTDQVFGAANPFEAGIADIVMLNIYSNYSEDGTKALLPTVVQTYGQGMIQAIKNKDPKARIFVSLGAFRDLPQFVKPEATDLRRDIEAALSLDGVENISFFGWGPERYPQTEPGWYLPRDGKDLIDTIKTFTTEPQALYDVPEKSIARWTWLKRPAVWNL